MQKIILSVLWLVITHLTWAQTPDQRAELDRIQKEKNEAKKELEQLNNRLNEIRKSKKKSLAELAMVQNKIRLRSKIINSLNSEIESIQNTINQNRIEVQRLKQELDTLKSQYAKSILYEYKNRNSYDYLNFIFNAKNFNDAMRRVVYLRNYRLYRSQQANQIRLTQNMLQGKNVEMQRNVLAKTDVLKEQGQEMAKLKEEKDDQDKVVKEIKSKEKELAVQFERKKKQLTKLQSAITVALKQIEKDEANKKRLADAEAARIKKEEADKLKANPNTPKTTIAKTNDANTKVEEPKTTREFMTLNKEEIVLASSFERAKGSLPWPVDKGEVKYAFGKNQIPNLPIYFNNPGLTVQTNIGAIVKAVFKGQVYKVFFVGNTTTVMVQHGNYFTLYSNLIGVTLKPGEIINVGQVIGKAAENDDNDGDGQIDFLVMKNKTNLNPEQWLRRR